MTDNSALLELSDKLVRLEAGGNDVPLYQLPPYDYDSRVQAAQNVTLLGSTPASGSTAVAIGWTKPTDPNIDRFEIWVRRSAYSTENPYLVASVTDAPASFTVSADSNTIVVAYVRTIMKNGLSTEIGASPTVAFNVTQNPAIIADGSVTTNKLANLAVTSAKINNLAVGTAQIDNLAVTGAKIANATIGTANIANAAITTALIANAAITNALINDLAVSKLTSWQGSTISVGTGFTFSGSFGTITLTSTALEAINGGDKVSIKTNGTVAIHRAPTADTVLAFGGLTVGGIQVVGGQQVDPGLPTFASVADAQTWCRALRTTLLNHGLIG
jgi:hypothetical protein